MNEWMGFINSEGKVENVEELKRLVHAGVCQSCRNYSFLATQSCFTKAATKHAVNGNHI
jgi:hypothetical protein